MRFMKRFLTMVLFAGLFFAGAFQIAQGQNELKIWKDFVNTLMNNKMTLERIRPLAASKETLMGWLNSLKEKASLKELSAEPEFHHVENLVHYILPLTYEGDKVDYCFTFLMEGNTWYFHGLEAIFIRLDKIASLPTSEFPDIPENQKAVHREEIRTADLVQQFNYFVKEKGRDFALSFLKDGNGYFLAAKVRVPFLPPSRAFVLYLCLDQANLVGNNVTLEILTDNEAVIRMETIYFMLYKVTSHLKDQISFEDYRQIFESIWQDRAEKAGWKLKIEYQGEYPGAICVFRLTK
jgi:hypothetical protein